MKYRLLSLERISKEFTAGDKSLSVLKGVTLTLNAGEMVGLVGQSGAGKSTLLQIAGCLDTPSSGSVIIDGADVTKATDKVKTVCRARFIGFVYQSHRLLSDFTALENVMLPQLVLGLSSAEAEQRGKELLKRVGLEERLSHRPAKLSGGEQQRVALARALANQPKILLADEPTGNLDSKTAAYVFDMLLEMVREHRTAALVATHNPELARRMDRVVVLEDGILV